MIGTIALCCLGMAGLALFRSGWLDEYWTVWHSDPAVPFRDAYMSRWIQDAAHPPTFYAFAWVMAHVTGPTLAIRRLVDNGLAFALCVGPTCAIAMRRGAAERWWLLYALLMLSGPFSVAYFAEHRSYFAGLAAAACLVAVLRQLHRESFDGSLRLALAAWFVVLTIVAMNIHYMISGCLLALLGCAAAFHWCVGCRRLALLIMISATIAILPLVLTLVFARRQHEVPVVVHLSLLRGWVTIIAVTIVGLFANPAMVAAAIRNWRAMSPAGASFAALLATSLSLLVVALAILHALSHNLVPRLLLGMLPMAAALVSEAASAEPLGRLSMALANLGALLTAAATVTASLLTPRW